MIPTTCPCGGRVEQGDLVGGRVRAKCLSCGRYEIFKLGAPDEPERDPNTADLFDEQEGDEVT